MPASPITEFPRHIPPTESQLAKILAILPEYDDGWSDDIEDALREDGYAHLKDASDPKVLPDMRDIDLSPIPGDRDVCFLTPMEEEGLLLRMDRSTYKESDEETIYNLEVFVYKLEDRPAVEAALFHDLAAQSLHHLLESLNKYCTPDQCVDVLRGAIQQSQVGAAWEAEEAARIIRSSIDPEATPKTSAPKIKKQGF